MKSVPALILIVIQCGMAVSTAVAQTAKASRSERPQIRQGDLQDSAVAPDFTLSDVTGKKSVTLSGLKGKPVVLIFGSCT